MPVELPDDWDACERGNTWLVEDEADSANHVGWFDLPGGRRLEVAVTPANYPGFTVEVLSAEQGTDARLAAHINAELRGWFVRRCHVEGVRVDDDRVADADETPEPEEDESE